MAKAEWKAVGTANLEANCGGRCQLSIGVEQPDHRGSQCRAHVHFAGYGRRGNLPRPAFGTQPLVHCPATRKPCMRSFLLDYALPFDDTDLLLQGRFSKPFSQWLQPGGLDVQDKTYGFATSDSADCSRR